MTQDWQPYLRLWRLYDHLREATRYLSTVRCPTDFVLEGRSFGDHESDIQIRADRELGQWFVSRLVEDGIYRRITVEGLPERHDDEGTYWAAVDPLDGSLNFRTRGETLGLPFTACITALPCQVVNTFKDISAAGVVDLRSGDVWFARGWLERDDHNIDLPGDGEYTCLYGIGHPVRLFCCRGDRLDLGRQIVFGDLYYPENRERLTRAFAGEKGWLRNCGSAAYEMAMVASGAAVAFICDRQKQHELGAGYALVKAGGGVAVDFAGRDLRETVYDFRSQTPVVLAANQAIADQILERLHRS